MLTFPTHFGARLTVALILGACVALATRPLPAQAATAADDAAALQAAVTAERARPRAPKLDRNLFLSRSSVRDVALSPDGLHVAWLRELGNNRSVWLLPTAGGEPQRVLANTEATHLGWSRDSRWLLLETSRQVFALAMDGQPGSGVITTLGGRTQREVVAVDRTLPASILVLEHPPIVSREAKRWRLFRIDMQGTRTLLHEDAHQIVGLALDPRGRLAWLLRAEGDAHVLHRIDEAGELHEALRCVRMERCVLLATMNDGRDLLLRTDAQGKFERLARLHADGRLETLHLDPRHEADVHEVTLDPLTQQPLIASYRSTVAASYGLTEDSARHVDAINRSFPGRNLQIDVGSGAGAHWLVRDRAGSLRGSILHLYDPDTGTLRPILQDTSYEVRGESVPRPPESAMARMIAFGYRASDGMLLHGFLMLPPGVDPATAPLIANVHGGPFNVVRPEFSNNGQFLANRGYIVFEPNFRGSTGHGRDYMLAANGDFGNGRVQQDIVEGVRYLLSQGIGDAQRVGIMGGSFGGYSTLVGVTFQPELFKIGIAAVPPADFGWTLRQIADSSTEMVRGVSMADVMRLLSLDPADEALAKRLSEQSPMQHADALHRPLLMLAGGEDERVPIRGVTHYAAQLKSLGKDVSLFVDADAGHDVSDFRTIDAYYFLIEDLLHRHLGGAAPQPADKELREHIKRNLRLAGRDLQDLVQGGNQ